MTRDEACWLPATELLERVRREDGAWEEVVEAIAARRERVNPAVNAYCTTTLDVARAQARALHGHIKAGERDLPLLDGVPASLKDRFEVPGVRTTWGPWITADNGPSVDGR
ncbi:MAG: hypothetical protein JW839_21170 [Candidatus Lokiarchaeota archaeon]|nr:hypothetical protein [Candidatus Lokiarchaeota archaeon]